MVIGLAFFQKVQSGNFYIYMMKSPRKIFYVAAVLLLQAFNNADASHNYSFSNYDLWNGKHSTDPFAFGKTGFSTFGETFTAPLSKFLGFEFWLYSDWPTWASGAEAEVYHWSGPLRGSGGHADGEPLYKGPVRNVYGGAFAFNRAEVIFPDPINLTQGDSYIALLTISDPAVYELNQNLGVWGAIRPYDYYNEVENDGGFQWQNTGNDPTRLTSAPWDTQYHFGSLVWMARFPGIGIPEIDGLAGGSALTLVCTALALLSERRKRLASGAQYIQ
jgi:hypothetical protein